MPCGGSAAVGLRWLRQGGVGGSVDLKSSLQLSNKMIYPE
jgi:hypothetical protein